MNLLTSVCALIGKAMDAIPGSPKQEIHSNNNKSKQINQFA